MDIFKLICCKNSTIDCLRGTENNELKEAVFVAQLVERSLPTPEVRNLNPVIGKIYIVRLLSTVLKRQN